MPRIALVLLLLFVLILACGQSGPTQEETASQPVTAPDTPTPEPAPDTPTPEPTAIQPPPTPAPIALSGQGQSVQKIELDPGIIIADMSYAGQTNFSVVLLDSQGQTKDMLANEIGSFQGSKAITIQEGGAYALNITADGEWKLDLHRPDSKVTSLPVELSGQGPLVSPFLDLAGLTTFTMHHEGQTNFAVVLLNQDGQTIDLLANEIGAFDGSKAVGATGPHLLNIDADGPWTIKVE